MLEWPSISSTSLTSEVTSFRLTQYCACAADTSPDLSPVLPQTCQSNISLLHISTGTSTGFANLTCSQLLPSSYLATITVGFLVFFLSHLRANLLANPIGSPFKIHPTADHSSPPPLPPPCSKRPSFLTCITVAVS